MNTGEKTIKREANLSTLWIFVTLNYLYCDVVAFFDAGMLRQIMTGSVGGIQFTQSFLLGSSILMEIPIAMVLLSRILKQRINRRVNISAGAIMTLVQFSSLFVGSAPTAYYIFFSVIEIACTSFVVWYAWKWKFSDREEWA